MDKELYEKLLYLVWCIELEKEISYCSSHEEFEKFKLEAEYHCGDCTQEPMTCSRCLLQRCEITAQNMYDYLKRR